ncbi:MAG: SH3 domain-containing protein [Tissierellia bacterium]|nr:SH3 domain-containing protein [Tissierellia bacterium]
MIIFLTSCSKTDEYQSKNIEIQEDYSSSHNKINEGVQIDGLYELNEDTNLYDKPSEDSHVSDQIKKGSIVKVILIDGDFSYVEYFHMRGYVLSKYLK